MKVCVAQCPNGASAFKRAPRRARPRRRVILVVVPVSSRKTSRWIASRMRGWRCAFHSSRAWRTSSRPASVASSVFFERQTCLQQHPRQRGRMRRHSLLGFQLATAAGIVMCGSASTRSSEPPVRAPVFRHLANPSLSRRLRRPRLGYPVRQLHRKACTDIVPPSRRPPRLPLRSQPQHAPEGQINDYPIHAGLPYPVSLRIRFQIPWESPLRISDLSRDDQLIGSSTTTGISRWGTFFW